MYYSYVHGTMDANRTRIGRARFEDDQLRDFEVLFESADPKERGQHFGSRLLFLPDGTLLATIGDGGNPPVAVVKNVY